MAVFFVLVISQEKDPLYLQDKEDLLNSDDIDLITCFPVYNCPSGKHYD